MKAYLCLITWADGREGLLFPRPGNVPVADTEEQGRADFDIARRHLLHYFEHIDEVAFPLDKPVTIRLVEFERGPELASVTIE